MKKFVSLSDKSLAAVWKWADENAGNALADVYMTCCGGISSQLMAGLIADVVATQPSKAWCRAYEAANAAIVLGYEARDTIGRLILEQIKVEANGTPA